MTNHRIVCFGVMIALVLCGIFMAAVIYFKQNRQNMSNNNNLCLQEHTEPKNDSLDFEISTLSVKGYDQFKKALRKFLLNKDYEKASYLLQRFDDNINSLDEDEEASYLAIKTYIFLMESKFDNAVLASESLTKKFPGFVSKMIHLFCLMRADQTERGLQLLDDLEKESISEANFLIMLYFCRSIIFYSLKNNESGFKEYKKFNELFKNHFQNHELTPEYYHMKENVKILMENPTEYSLELSDEPPPPPEPDEDDPEKVSFVINLNYKIISNKDGQVVFSGSIGL